MKNYRNGREYIKCIAEDCEILTSSVSGLCTKHYKQRWYLNQVGRDSLLTRTSKGRWIHTKYGYVLIKVNGMLVYEHRLLAEKALGRPLPESAVVHHMVAPDDNHGFLKLVICPDQEYHMLLHRRMGHANNQYG